MKTFLKNLKKALKTHFKENRVEYLIQTLQSLKANVHLEEGYFIAVRYNARNGRTDVALISEGRRIFGYDNLKQWHIHPYEDPEKHIACEPPSVEEIISATKQCYEADKSKSEG